MWFIPLLIIGAFVVAAAARSPREIIPSSRQLSATGVSGGPPRIPPGVPGPIAVLGALLRSGQYPPPLVILCAIAEAESIGRGDLASDIVSIFVAPVVYQHQRERGGLPGGWGAPVYERGSCALFRAPRGQTCSPREACFYPDPRMQPPRGREACASREPSQTSAPSTPTAPKAVVTPQVDQRSPSEDEIFAMLHTDPQAFVDMVASQPQRRGPLVEIFPIGMRPPTSSEAPPSPPPMPPPVTPVPVPSSPTLTETLAAQLLPLPGFVEAGVVLADPASGSEVFEVRWLRGHALPPLPQMIAGRAVRIAIVDNFPVPQMDATPYDTAVQSQAQGPGSPLPGVPDDAWRQFVALLARESPTFSSSRHVGQFRQRRERLAEFGVDPQAILGSAAAQRQALDIDLTDAHHHATAGGVLAEHLGKPIAIPGHERPAVITLSGVLGVIQCGGLDGAVGWLESLSDRKRYPHTTHAFLRTNGVF